MSSLVEEFLAQGPFAVVGASNNRTKFGNRVLRAYLEHSFEAFPVHPTEKEIEGRKAYASLSDLPRRPRGVSIITPPAVTEMIVQQAADVGADFVWMQPGAESDHAIELAERLGLRVIAGGPCLLVEIAR